MIIIIVFFFFIIIFQKRKLGKLHLKTKMRIFLFINPKFIFKLIQFINRFPANPL